MSNTIFGYRGWYYKMDSGKLYVAITCHKLLNKYFGIHDYVYPPGSEDFRYMTEAEFTKLNMAKKLQVPTDVKLQGPLCEWHDKKYSTSPKKRPVSG